MMKGRRASSLRLTLGLLPRSVDAPRPTVRDVRTRRCPDGAPEPKHPGLRGNSGDLHSVAVLQATRYPAAASALMAVFRPISDGPRSSSSMRLAEDRGGQSLRRTPSPISRPKANGGSV